MTMARDFPGFFLYLYDHVFITFYISIESTRHVVKYGRVLYLCISFHYNPYDMLFVPVLLRNMTGFCIFESAIIS